MTPDFSVYHVIPGPTPLRNNASLAYLSHCSCAHCKLNMERLRGASCDPDETLKFYLYDREDRKRGCCAIRVSVDVLYAIHDCALGISADTSDSGVKMISVTCPEALMGLSAMVIYIMGSREYPSSA